MITHFLDAATASNLPLISSPDIRQLTMDDPSTFELAMIGVVTLAAYWGVKRLVSSSKGAGIAVEGADGEAILRDDRVDEPARGAA